jgi:hypothetical protein
MRKFVALLYLCLLASAGNALSQVRVAVSPFEVADYSLEPYAEHARGVLEDLLIGMGRVEVVERARMDAMTQELALGQFSGLADASQAAQYGRMAGARYLVTGSLLKADTEVRDFQGYGVRTRTAITTATLRIRAFDVERGAIVHSTVVTGESKSFNTSSGGQGSTDATSAAIDQALNTLTGDERFRNIFADVAEAGTATAQVVALEIAPVQENCDLEINGDYHGSTPATVKLPAGASVTIRLSKAGHAVWERTMTVRDGLRITPELERL